MWVVDRDPNGLSKIDLGHSWFSYSSTKFEHFLGLFIPWPKVESLLNSTDRIVRKLKISL